MKQEDFEKILEGVDFSGLPERETLEQMEAKLSEAGKKYTTWRRACMDVQYFPSLIDQSQVFNRLGIQEAEVTLIDQIQLEEIRLKDGEAGIAKHNIAERDIMEQLKKRGNIYYNFIECLLDALSDSEDED